MTAPDVTAAAGDWWRTAVVRFPAGSRPFLACAPLEHAALGADAAAWFAVAP